MSKWANREILLVFLVNNTTQKADKIKSDFPVKNFLEKKKEGIKKEDGEVEAIIAVGGLRKRWVSQTTTTTRDSDGMTKSCLIFVFVLRFTGYLLYVSTKKKDSPAPAGMFLTH